MLEDAIRFPSDPDTTILEDNDVAVLLRSDSLDNIADGAKALFGDLGGIFRVTSVRKGFAGGGFGGGAQPAEADGGRGRGSRRRADSRYGRALLRIHVDPRRRRSARRIANFETLGYVDLGRTGYFAGGTTCTSRTSSRTSRPGT